MDKQEHGKRLAAAMAAKRFDRQVIADATQRDKRTVTNWTSGKTMPSTSERIVLRRLLGDYDNPGDPVEVAIDQSELQDWRKDAVRSFYKRNLYEQRGEVGA